MFVLLFAVTINVELNSVTESFADYVYFALIRGV